MKIRLKRNNMKIVVLLVCVGLVLGGSLLVLNALQQKNQWARPANAGTQNGAQEQRVLYNDVWYVPKDEIETILVIGLDKYQTPEQKVGYLNDQQADFLLLLVVDHKTQTCDVLHLNRDTMTEIQRLGVGGGEAGLFNGQLALSHTFGSGGSDSCINTARAVSKLLGGVKINHYMALTMDAVAKVNDRVGGVTVTVMDDFTKSDPKLVKGEEVCLTGEQALTYVRGRTGLRDSSNLHRMERQRQYMSALYEQFEECAKKDDSFFRETLLEITEYFRSDCTVNQLEKLNNALKDCTMNPIRTLEGKAVTGDEFMEFYVDERSLEKTIMELFYQREK